MLLAALVVIEYLDSLLPIRQVFSLAICGVIVWIVAEKYGSKMGFIFYLAAGILLSVLLPNKEKAIYFILFFGLYSCLRVFIARISLQWLSYVIKLLVMNALIFVSVFAISKILLDIDIIKTDGYSFILIIGGMIALQAILIVYDFGLSFISKYLKRFIV